jgi:putative ribosome biogenesis GTPase RsgA
MTIGTFVQLSINKDGTNLAKPVFGHVHETIMVPVQRHAEIDLINLGKILIIIYRKKLPPFMLLGHTCWQDCHQHAVK